MKARKLAAPFVVVAVAAVPAACGSSSSSPDGGAPIVNPPGHPQPDADLDAPSDAIFVETSNPPGPKPPLVGLVDMQDISWHNIAGAEPAFTMANVEQFPEVLGGLVINATWDQMQPTSGGAVDFSKVDAALAQVATYNTAHPAHPLGTKLRIYGGANAPDWAKAIGGAPISIQRNTVGNCDGSSCPLTIGRMWSAGYITAWRAFLGVVAGKYDGDFLVRHVTVTSCAQQTDEPFVPTLDATSQANLTAAGFTDQLQKDCLSGAVDDYAAWKLTNVDYTINPFVPLNGPADGTTFPESVMTACRTTLGSRCVLGNHALSAPPRTGLQAIYTALKNDGAPISFQTEAPQGMGCLWTQTVAQGIALHADSIEIWPKASLGGFDGFTVPELTQLASQFTTPIVLDPNPQPLPTPCSGFH